jgi:pyrrolysine biosynthesis protein PylD
MQAFVTERADVSGLTESLRRGADLIFLSDDHRFAAICPAQRQAVDNIDATAIGFTTGLSLMAGGLEEKQVLVLGCGPVGKAAAATLTRMGARVGLCDLKPDRSTRLADSLREKAGADPQVVDPLSANLKEWPCLYDATNSAGLIHTSDITPYTRVAAPGVPCGVVPSARKALGKRLLCDPLQIGVATMAVMGLKIIMSSPPVGGVDGDG